MIYLICGFFLLTKVSNLCTLTVAVDYRVKLLVEAITTCFSNKYDNSSCLFSGFIYHHPLAFTIVKESFSKTFVMSFVSMVIGKNIGKLMACLYKSREIKLVKILEELAESEPKVCP